MDIFKKLAEKIGLIEENKTEKIMNERNQLKKTMAENLEKIGFSESEIEEVISILNKSEEEIQKHKDSLIGTNINNPDPSIIMKEVFDEIRYIELKTAKDIKEKIAEIRSRKGI